MSTADRRRYEQALADYRRALARAGETLMDTDPEQLPAQVAAVRAALASGWERLVEAEQEAM